MPPVDARRWSIRIARISACTKQCKLLKISRSSLYFAPVGVNAETLKRKNEIERVFTEYPFYGSRQIAA